jgi:DNA polymerase elongation subunit (family B)
MAIQTAVGWILDVSQYEDSNEIIILIKLQDGKVIRFKQRLQERIIHILPRSYSAGQDLFQQLSRNDQFIKRIFWDEKFNDLQDKTRTSLIGISLSEDRQDFKKFVEKLRQDSRVKALYNIDTPEVTQFIYTQLKIPPTSKVKIEYDDETEKLLSIIRIDDSKEIDPPPFSTTYIEVLNEPATTDINDTNKTHPLKLSMRINGHTTTTLAINDLSDPAFISNISQNNSDIVILCGNYQLLYSQNNKNFVEYLRQRVVIHTHNTIHETHLIELLEKSRFGYLPLKFALRYGMIRLIDSRITYELLQREFVIPTRLRTISKHHEQIRTLENIVDMDKAGMIVSPEIGLHENVAVLDFNDEYANLILRHNISYETSVNSQGRASEQQYGSPIDTETQTALLPAIMNEIVSRRIYLKRQLKEEHEPNSSLHDYCEMRLEILKQILVCLYGTSGSIWNRYSNVGVFEEINKRSRQILLKTKDIVQSSGFELIYADTDAVFLKRKGATKTDYENIMNELIRDIGLDMTLEYHYKFLVLLFIEADEKMEARKHYYGLTYDNQLITRGIDTRRHDSPVFIKEFQRTLLSKLFDCNNSEEVLSSGYQNVLLHITHSIDKLMNGEIQITDLVISKLLRQNIEKYTSLFPHVSAAIKLNLSGVITDRGENIKYVYTDSNHADPLQRITPAKLISSEEYDKKKYLEMLLDSAEAVLAVFGFNRSLFGFDRKKSFHWWDEIYQQRERDIESAKSEL